MHSHGLPEADWEHADYYHDARADRIAQSDHHFGEVAVKEIPTIYCEQGQSIWEAAKSHGYTAPLHRVGAMRDARPMDGEMLVARVRAGKHSLSLPIFRKMDTTCTERR